MAPAVMGEGAPEFVTVKFTAATAVVFTVVVLLAALGSLVADVTAEVAVRVVLFGVAAFTFTVMLMFATDPAARLAAVQVTVPVAADGVTLAVYVTGCP